MNYGHFHSSMVYRYIDAAIAEGFKNKFGINKKLILTHFGSLYYPLSKNQTENVLSFFVYVFFFVGKIKISINKLQSVKFKLNFIIQLSDRWRLYSFTRNNKHHTDAHNWEMCCNVMQCILLDSQIVNFEQDMSIRNLFNQRNIN